MMRNLTLILSVMSILWSVNLLVSTSGRADERRNPPVLIQQDAGFATLVLETGESVNLATDVGLATGGSGKDGYWSADYGNIKPSTGQYTAPKFVPVGSMDSIVYWSSRPSEAGQLVAVHVTIVPKGHLQAKPLLEGYMFDAVSQAQAIPIRTVDEGSKSSIIGVILPSFDFGRKIVVYVPSGRAVEDSANMPLYICHRRGPFNPLPTVGPKLTGGKGAIDGTLSVTAGWDPTIQTQDDWHKIDTLGDAMFNDKTIPEIKKLYGITMPPCNKRLVGRGRSIVGVRTKYVDYYRCSLDRRKWIYERTDAYTQRGFGFDFDPPFLSVFSDAEKSGTLHWYPTECVNVQTYYAE